jgi:hypothetical protein
VWHGFRYLIAGPPTGRRTFRVLAIKTERLRRRDRWRYSWKRRLRSVDRVPVDRPIFVLGLQGGGTTLIARCLLRHRDVVSMSGNSGYWVATDELGFVRNRMAVLPRSLWSSSHRIDLDHPLFGTDHRSVWASDALLPFYRQVRADAVAADGDRFKRVLREHIAVYARDPMHARFLDKTHTNTVRIGYLDALLEGADPFFVLVVRNPYTVCTRALRRKPPSWRKAVSPNEQLEIMAAHWENAYRIAFEEGRATGRFAAVRFEDFVRAPTKTVRAICESVELEFDAALVPRAGDRLPFATLPNDTKWYPVREEDWRPHVSDDDAAIIERRCGALARRLGYERVADSAPERSELLSI